MKFEKGKGIENWRYAFAGLGFAAATLGEKLLASTSFWRFHFRLLCWLINLLKVAIAGGNTFHDVVCIAEIKARLKTPEKKKKQLLKLDA